MKELSPGLFLLVDECGHRFVWFARFDFLLHIRENGYVPKSGILLADVMDRMDIHGKVVLDIGTGEIGFLAHYAFLSGARRVVGGDIDAGAIAHAREASLFSGCIEWVESDVYARVPAIRYDLIVSNPPQMPMSEPDLLHDYGGWDGRDTILAIIKKARGYLGREGKLLLLCFDFLGTTESHNDHPSIADIAENHGLECRLVGHIIRKIRRGGKTEMSMDWISKIYPGYKFNADKEGGYYHHIDILEFRSSF